MPDTVKPSLECDLILKGGITSGIVYPGVATELAKTYRFRSIGGTSAGAIAASAIAAAEYGRQTDREGFTELAELPAWLGRQTNGESNLKNLFRPNTATERLHSILTAGLVKESRLQKIITKLIQHYARAFFLGAIPGLLIAVIFILFANGPLNVLGLLSGLFIALVGASIWTANRFFRTSSKAINNNYLGLTTGHDPLGCTSSPMLTDWLTAYLDKLAGLEEREKPLTFGDLNDHDITLHMITTCLTHGRPYNLPFDNRIFFIKKADLRAFFPQKIATWLEEKAKEQDTYKEGSEYLQLPKENDLPVAFATRLSLSFPVLISAVPLYAKDHSRRDEADREMERCWFTDGGVSSNFPVHLFDAALPSRPTFAVNLKPHHIDYGEDSWDFDRHQGVWMPASNAHGAGNWWTRFNDQQGLLSLLSFFKVMVEAGFNWQDTLLAGRPGQRDRIVQVGLASDEGGLNLNMERCTIDALFERGQKAGRMLVDRFAQSKHRLDWDNHKWVRYRSFMAALDQTLLEYRKAFEKDPALGKRYQELIDRTKDQKPKSYRFNSEETKQLVQEITTALLALAETSSSSAGDLQLNAPQPVSKLSHAQKL